MTSAHSRLARDMDMRMEHFDIVLEHLGGALSDLHVSEVELFPTRATPVLFIHPRMVTEPLLGITLSLHECHHELFLQLLGQISPFAL